MKHSKKKLTISATAIGLSAVLLGASAFAASSNLTAYNQAKETLLSANKQVFDFKNLTTETVLQIEKDGQPWYQQTALNKSDYKNINEQNNYYKNTFTVNGQTFELENWMSNSKTSSKNITKDSASDEYKVSEFVYSDPITDEYESYQTETSAADQRFASALIDFAAGDIKNYFTFDGSSPTVHLEGAQIPELLQLAIASVQSQASQRLQGSNSYQTFSSNEEKSLYEEIASLKDLSIEQIDATLFNTNDINIKLIASGYDINGKKHTYTLKYTTKTSNVGSTQVDTIDLTGKKVSYSKQVTTTMNEDTTTTTSPTATATSLTTATPASSQTK